MKYLVPLIVLAVAVCGFAYYTLFSTPDIVTNVAEQPAAQQPSASVAPALETETKRTSFSGEGTIFGLMSRGDTLECAITYIPNPIEPSITGSIFTNEGDIRGDFVVPKPDLNGSMVTSVIIAEGTVWQWTDIDGEIFGSKQPADLTSSVLSRLVSPVGFDTSVQYDCLTWPQVDRTIFEAPANVLFTDPTAAVFEEGVIFEE